MATADLLQRVSDTIWELPTSYKAGMRVPARTLLFDFLQRLVYYKDAELLLLRVPDVATEHADGRWRLRARARGERLDALRHRQRVDVKAVTLHRFRLEQNPEGWRVFVILDV